MASFIRSLFLLQSLATVVVLGIDENANKELKCIPPSGLSIDLTWIGGSKILYAPLWSPLSHCRKAAIQNAIPVKDLKKSDVMKPSCFEFYTATALVKAFGKENTHNVALNDTVMICKGTDKFPMMDIYSYHLTDNKSYLLSITCWEDGWASWTVFSNQKELEPKVKSEILAYLASKGFNPKKAVIENYSSCK